MEDAFDASDANPAQAGHTFDAVDNAFANRRCGGSDVNRGGGVYFWGVKVFAFW